MRDEVRVEVDGAVHTGNAVDLRDAAVTAGDLLEAIRDPSDESVSSPEPGPVHDHVGLVRPGMALSLPTAIADAARSTGETAPQDDDLAAVRAELASLDPPGVDLAAARRRVSVAGADEAALREAVARLRGELDARRDVGADDAGVATDLRDAVRRLSEVETERLAAEQALDRARERARAARTARGRRLHLQDRERNLARAARQHLVDEQYDAFATAVEAVPGRADPGGGPDEFAGDDVTAALGVVRLADLDAPVVLACDRFADAAAAHACLDAPVLKV